MIACSSDLSVSSLGRRGSSATLSHNRRHRTCCTRGSDSGVACSRDEANALGGTMKETTDLVIEDLGKESVFFVENIPSRPLPKFKPSEIETGEILGKGDFGIVYEVATFNTIDLNECACRKCRKARERVGEGGGETSVRGSNNSNKNGSCHGGGGSSVRLVKTMSPPNSIVLRKVPQMQERMQVPLRLSNHNFRHQRLPSSSGGSIVGKFIEIEVADYTVGDEEEGLSSPVVDGHPDGDTVNVDFFSGDLTVESNQPCGGGDSAADFCLEEDEDGADLFLDIDDVNLNGRGGGSSLFCGRDDEEHLDKVAMSARCCARGSGVARYAVKMIKPDIGEGEAEKRVGELRMNAGIDLACEAEYLKRFSHSNIVRIRATVGVPGTLDFAFIMDRLVMTLHEKITEWDIALNPKKGAQSERHGRRGAVGFFRRLFSRRRRAVANDCNQTEATEVAESLFMERLLALYDIARAMKYLHEKKMLYRDLKPENIGVDMNGDMRIFDFGIAKELKANELVEYPDGYDATGLTGSRRYMAPEVAMCLPYGYSSDVYSYGILFWYVVSLTLPFDGYSAVKHSEKVITRGERPRRLPFLAQNLHQMMEQCWSNDRRARPSFQQICQVLRSDIIERKGGARDENEALGKRGSFDSIADRTLFLRQVRSLSSLSNPNEPNHAEPYH